ncbi:hypothetical protein FOL47_002008 [Perkinsus chesapeaki]|uniref:Uncharacterized protein n=1 Tax=Perkinsus chesapeaki TaxID=330153 RepID=A0A7J6KR05_PERCH|nr:hypothetical protein FOL47_002008 [Perkinsus chesapeaki]
MLTDLQFVELGGKLSIHELFCSVSRATEFHHVMTDVLVIPNWYSCVSRSHPPVVPSRALQRGIGKLLVLPLTPVRQLMMMDAIEHSSMEDVLEIPNVASSSI